MAPQPSPTPQSPIPGGPPPIEIDPGGLHERQEVDFGTPNEPVPNPDPGTPPEREEPDREPGPETDPGGEP